MKNLENCKEIYLAGGCFWGTEHFLKQINGVIKTEVGYANSIIKDPTYEQVCTGETKAAETVKVIYDSYQLEIPFIINLFFLTIDPTSVNKQGEDVGLQYRTGIYYSDINDKYAIEETVNILAKNYDKPLAIEIKPLENFYSAETYHQDYLDKNPSGYCHINPALFKIAKEANSKTYSKPSEEKLREKLSPLEYEVTQNGDTEPPFDNKYYDEFRKGIYVDITTGEPLFLSNDKYDSGCGWPAFSKPITKDILEQKIDTRFGRIRTEVKSKNGQAHLGHVFNDGPEELGGIRYCINSASLKFIPLEEMEKEGYGDFIKLVK